MDKNAFQTELDRVRFTQAGREALTEVLMKGEQQAAPAPRRMSWVKRGAAAGLAAVVLMGSALAAGPLWERFFGRLNESQQEVIQTLSQDLPAAESNGTTMTPLAAFGDEDFYYLMLEIKPPEGIVLPEDKESCYTLHSPCNGAVVTLSDGVGEELPIDWDSHWLPRTSDDSPLTAIIRLWSDGVVDFSDGTDKLLHIPGLWTWVPGENEIPVFTGNWDFNIGAYSGGIQAREPNVSGVTTEYEGFGTLTLDYLRISPLGMRWRYHWEDETPPDAESPNIGLAAIVTELGREIALSGGGASWNFEQEIGETYGAFEAPVDLSKVAYIRWGTAKIPLN